VELFHQLRNQASAPCRIGFDQLKRCGVAYLLVQGRNARPCDISRLIDLEFLQSIQVLQWQRSGLWSQRFLQVSLRELHYSRHEVPKTICEVGIVGVAKALKRKVAIFKWVGVPGQKQPQRIDAIVACESQRLNDITEALAHLLAATRDEPVIHDSIGVLDLP